MTTELLLENEFIYVVIQLLGINPIGGQNGVKLELKTTA